MTRAQWVFLCGALLILSSTGVEAGGGYQKTKDRKTSVWNPDPQPGDAATWSGERDEERYATGYGTLTWYRVEKKFAMGSRLPLKKEFPVIQYSGTMVRGKLEGHVVGVDNGKTYHATFANGVRNGEWAAGPGDNAERTPRKAEQVQAEPKPQPEAAPPELETAPARDDDIAAVEPPKIESTPKPRPSVAAKKTQRIELPSSSATPAPAAEVAVPVVRNSPTVAPAPASTRSHMPEVEVATSATIEAGDRSPALPASTAVPTPSPVVAASSAPLPSAHQASSGLSLGGSERRTAPPVYGRSPIRRRSQANDLLKSLAITPPSLGFGSTTFLGETTPAPAAAATPPTTGGRLTAEEVIGLANAELRANGNLLSDYQAPQAKYAAESDSWSVSYEQKAGPAATGAGKRISVVVEDKTKKASMIER